jgi:hypothetical protein
MALLSVALFLQELISFELLQLAVVLLVLLRLHRFLPIWLVRFDVLWLQMNGIKVNATMLLDMLATLIERLL